MRQAELGVQSYTYRQFDVKGIVKELEGTGVTALELWPKHLGPGSPPEQIEKCRGLLEDSGLRVCGTGVSRFSSQRPDEIRPALEFAAGLGADYVSIDVRPDDARGKELLIEAAVDLGLLLAIHNHGPEHHYDVAENVLTSCEGYDEVLGACVDTGNFLRADQDAERAIEVLGRRVHAVHLKDFVDADTEVVPGTGRLNYATMLEALRTHTDFHSALVIEYEADPEDPTAGVRQAVGVLRQALEAAQ